VPPHLTSRPSSFEGMSLVDPSASRPWYGPRRHLRIRFVEIRPYAVIVSAIVCNWRHDLRTYRSPFRLHEDRGRSLPAG